MLFSFSFVYRSELNTINLYINLSTKLFDVKCFFVDFNLSTMYVFSMEEKPKKTYINTTVSHNLLRPLKILAAQEGVRINQLLEEAIADLLRKYEKKVKK